MKWTNARNTAVPRRFRLAGGARCTMPVGETACRLTRPCTTSQGSRQGIARSALRTACAKLTDATRPSIRKSSAHSITGAISQVCHLTSPGAAGVVAWMDAGRPNWSMFVNNSVASIFKGSNQDGCMIMSALKDRTRRASVMCDRTGRPVISKSRQRMGGSFSIATSCKNILVASLNRMKPSTISTAIVPTIGLRISSCGAVLTLPVSESKTRFAGQNSFSLFTGCK